MTHEMTHQTRESSIPATTGDLVVSGARLHYEVRGAGPVLALVGAPMDASAFEPAASSGREQVRRTSRRRSLRRPSGSRCR
jgi:hypothetical protein